MYKWLSPEMGEAKSSIRLELNLVTGVRNFNLTRGKIREADHLATTKLLHMLRHREVANYQFRNRLSS